MTARTSIERLADCAPVAHSGSWVVRDPPSIRPAAPSISWPDPLFFAPVMDPTSAACIALARASARIEAILRANTARQDADAKLYGEPRDPHEFYRGRRIK